ncbi:endo-1,4-beta-xylanase [Kribbella sp. HUAS MG21]|uniref:Beta-xylanase n=1 Tax=Kribbella sp. HUAS MG21 TaxID=3160966 RepID=A0AAU7T5X5_9ACTN
MKARLLPEPSPYLDIVANQFSTVTAENEMKWALTEPVQGQHTWAAADRLVDFAEQNHQVVRGHTLVWHNQLPKWVTSQPWTPAELRAILKKHITDEVTHFRGRIWAWDVVNEAFNGDGTLRDTMWLRALGPDYIADAFRWAHQADPKAKLFYNDCNIEGINAKSTAVLALVTKLRAEGVPIHGVGLQTHLGTQYDFPHTMQDNLERFAALDVDLAITEADVRVPLPVDGDDEARQVDAYQRALRACLAVSRCVSYTVWGVGDSYSWVPGTFPGQGWPLLYDDQLKPKAAYRAVQHDLSEAPNWAPHRSGRGAGRG